MNITNIIPVKGTLGTTEETPIATGPCIIRTITLYNPTGSALGFILRLAWDDEVGRRMLIRRFDDSMPATDAWTFGLVGGFISLGVGDVLELVLDSAPATPVEWAMDIVLS